MAATARGTRIVRGAVAVLRRGWRFGRRERVLVAQAARLLGPSISARRTLEDALGQIAELSEQALSDETTGLPNRRALLRHLAEARRRRPAVRAARRLRRASGGQQRARPPGGRRADPAGRRCDPGVTVPRRARRAAARLGRRRVRGLLPRSRRGRCRGARPRRRAAPRGHPPPVGASAISTEVPRWDEHDVSPTRARWPSSSAPSRRCARAKVVPQVGRLLERLGDAVRRAPRRSPAAQSATCRLREPGCGGPAVLWASARSQGVGA